MIRKNLIGGMAGLLGGLITLNVLVIFFPKAFLFLVALPTWILWAGVIFPIFLLLFYLYKTMR